MLFFDERAVINKLYTLLATATATFEIKKWPNRMFKA
ncbi:MAG: hypothetical protein RIR12_526 [Bacteroidota bacterium]|jgi:hypothetical protein